MSMFNPYWKCNYDELITFYPRFYRHVFEMNAILRAEGGLADGIQASIDKMLMNNFIDGADEDTLTQLEQFLGLSLMKQRTIEERRRFVKSFFVGQGKVSATRIAEMIRVYTGAETECEFYPFDSERNNRLDIQFDRGSETVIYISDIYLLLAKMLPAHIEYRAMVVYRFCIGIDKKRMYYKYAYDLCGTKPYLALLGDKNETVVETESLRQNFNYEYDVCNTEDCGILPETAMLAEINANQNATETVFSSYQVCYIPCGTKNSGML